MLDFAIDIIVLVGIIITAAFMVVAYRKFLKDEFSKILFWLTYSVVLIAAYKAVEVLNEYLPTPDKYLDILTDAFFAGAIVCCMVAAVLIHRFSKVYGFAAKTPVKNIRC